MLFIRGSKYIFAVLALGTNEVNDWRSRGVCNAAGVLFYSTGILFISFLPLGCQTWGINSKTLLTVHILFLARKRIGVFLRFDFMCEQRYKRNLNGIVFVEKKSTSREQFDKVDKAGEN